MTPIDKFIDIDGLRLHYLESGKPYRVIALDVRGAARVNGRSLTEPEALAALRDFYAL
jgi:hypothetical protein